MGFEIPKKVAQKGKLFSVARELYEESKSTSHFY